MITAAAEAITTAEGKTLAAVMVAMAAGIIVDAVQATVTGIAITTVVAIIITVIRILKSDSNKILSFFNV
jgi:hypothetical protein